MTFSIVRTMPAVLERYEQSHFAQENGETLRDLRAALALDPLRYRGVSRDPLRPIAAAQLPLVRPDSFDARARMAELCDDDELLGSVDSAREVRRLLEQPDEFEILGLFGERGSTLGYDIGDRGGDHFSVIADVAVTPRWHPPHPDDFDDLAERLRDLNEHLLFASAQAAAAFLEYYRTRDWAETAGELVVIHVTSVE